MRIVGRTLLVEELQSQPHSIIRIDEVEKQGTSKITSTEGSNIAQFPVPMYSPPDKSGPGRSGK